MKSKQNDILVALRGTPEGLTVSQISTTVGRGRGAVYASLNSMVERHEILCVGERPKKYTVAPDAVTQLKTLSHMLRVIANRIANGKESVLQGMQEVQQAIRQVFPAQIPA